MDRRRESAAGAGAHRRMELAELRPGVALHRRATIGGEQRLVAAAGGRHRVGTADGTRHQRLATRQTHLTAGRRDLADPVSGPGGGPPIDELGRRGRGRHLRAGDQVQSAAGRAGEWGM